MTEAAGSPAGNPTGPGSGTDRRAGTATGSPAPADAGAHRDGRGQAQINYQFGPPSKKGRSGRAKVAIGAAVVLAMVAAGAFVAAEVDGRDTDVGFGEAFSGEPCEFLTDREVQEEFGSAVAHDLESVVGRGFERAQDSRIVLERRETCVVTFDDTPVTFSGSPSAIVTMTEQSDASELFARTLRNAQNGGFLSESTVDVGDASFCTAPDSGGVGGVLARTGNRVTYVIYDRAEAGTTTESIVTDDSVSCREAARVARLVLN